MIKMEVRSRSCPDQFVKLIKFMERHGDIARPQPGLQGRIRAECLWLELQRTLNSVAGGVPKPVEKWKKVWADWKAKTKKKCFMSQHRAADAAVSNRHRLTAMEHRVLKVMGLSVATNQERTENRTTEEDKNDEEDRAIEEDRPNEEERPEVSIDPLQIKQEDCEMSPDAGDSKSDVLEVEVEQFSPSSSSKEDPSPREPAPVPTPPRPREQAGGSRALADSRMRLRVARGGARACERACAEFSALERLRLRLDEQRDRRQHERDLERIRLDEQRLQIEDARNGILLALVDTLRQFVTQKRRPSNER